MDRKSILKPAVPDPEPTPKQKLRRRLQAQIDRKFDRDHLCQVIVPAKALLSMQNYEHQAVRWKRKHEDLFLHHLDLRHENKVLERKLAEASTPAMKLETGPSFETPASDVVDSPSPPTEKIMLPPDEWEKNKSDMKVKRKEFDATEEGKRHRIMRKKKKHNKGADAKKTSEASVKPG